MRRATKRVLALTLLVASGVAAWSQTSPNWYEGLVPTPAQWNALFSSKQDTINFGADVLNVLEIPIGSPGAMIVNGGATVIGAANGGTGQSSLTVGDVLLGNGTSPVAFGTVSGNTTAFLTRDGSFTSGHCQQFDASGGTVDSGGPCGATVVTIGTTVISGGTTGRILYDAAGTVGELAVTGSGNVALATSPTFVTPILGTPTSGDASNLVNIPMGNATSTLTVAHGGTGAVTLTSGDVLLGNGTSAVNFGTPSGNTTTFGTTSGTLTSGHCVSIDSSHNLIDAGGTCTTGGAGGTVSSGTVGQLAVYTGTTTVNGTTTGTGVVTALGVNTGSAGAVVVNGGVLGTPSSGTLTNVTGLPVAGLGNLGSGWATPLTAALGSNWATAFAATLNSGVQAAFAHTLDAASGLVSYSALAADVYAVTSMAASVQTAITNAVNVASGLLQLNGSGFIPAIDKVGVTAGTTPTAGNVGEVLSSDVPVASQVSLANLTVASVTSKSISAGAWQCSGNIQTTPAAATRTQTITGWITSSPGFPAATEQNGTVAIIQDYVDNGDSSNIATGLVYFNFSSPTTVYLQTYAVFDSGTLKAYGRLDCLRIR